MVKHTQTIHHQQPTNYLTVFDHFVRLAVKGLSFYDMRFYKLRKFSSVSVLFRIFQTVALNFVYVLRRIR